MRQRALVATIVVLAIGLLASPSLLRAQEASPPAAGSSILAAYGEAWSSGDAAQVAALYTEDAVREDIPTGTTIAWPRRDRGVCHGAVRDRCRRAPGGDGRLRRRDVGGRGMDVHRDPSGDRGRGHVPRRLRVGAGGRPDSPGDATITTCRRCSSRSRQPGARRARWRPRPGARTRRPAPPRQRSKPAPSRSGYSPARRR